MEEINVKTTREPKTLKGPSFDEIDHFISSKKEEQKKSNLVFETEVGTIPLARMETPQLDIMSLHAEEAARRYDGYYIVYAKDIGFPGFRGIGYNPEKKNGSLIQK